MRRIYMLKQTFHNPLLSGFYPDPSICRVGEDYYMVTSSFVTRVPFILLILLFPKAEKPRGTIM